MDILRPPTDNLYKFLSLSGLLLFLFFVTYPTWLYVELNKQRVGLIRDLKILKYDAEEFQSAGKEAEIASKESQERAGRLADIVEKFEKRQITYEEAMKALDDSKTASADTLQKIDVLKKAINDWRKQDVEVEMKNDLLEINEEHARRVRTVALFGILISLSMTVMGFSLWYIRVQQYEDIILKNKTSSSAVSESGSISGESS